MTGIILTNIYSGYALAVEHFNLMPKLIFIGNAEQNTIAQLTQAAIGFGGMMVALVTVGQRLHRHGFTVAAQAAVLLVLLKPEFFSFFTLPKNDALLAGDCLLALAALMEGELVLFIGAAAVAFVIKPTAPFTFLAMAGAAVSCGVPRIMGGRRMILITLVLAATAMVLLWLPFAIHSYSLTGSPFFPLLNQLFRSPFAPTALEDVVTEMRPLSMGLDDHIHSIWTLLKFHHFYSLAAVALGATVIPALRSTKFARVSREFISDKNVRFIFAFCAFSMITLQSGLGEFGTLVENRHYMTLIAPLAFLCGSLVVVAGRGMGLDRILLIALFLLGTAESHIDVAVRKFAETFGEKNMTEDLLRRKPLLQINDFLSAGDSSPGHNRVRVIALTESNTGYFLKNGEFWHHSMTYPMWKWDLKGMQKNEWSQHFTEENVTHFIIEDRYKFKYPEIMNLPMSLIRTEKPYMLYAIRPPVDH